MAQGARMATRSSFDKLLTSFWMYSLFIMLLWMLLDWSLFLLLSVADTRVLVDNDVRVPDAVCIGGVIDVVPADVSADVVEVGR